MKYFIDTEFIEGFKKPLFGKRRHFIDLISIGIYAEDGREYYAISNEFNAKDADEWVKENVISKLPQKKVSYFDSPRIREESLLYRNNAMIANDIQGFIYGGGANVTHEFYGYYADYDWVLFCSLFGRMVDLPKGFPMYCIDLKQMLDEKAKEKIMEVENKYEGETRFETSLKLLKSHKDYPMQDNEHRAIDDAKWNYELYKFLTNETK